MSGKRYFLDTNAIVALLQGNANLTELLKNAEWIGVSIISQIEFLVFSGLSASDRDLFQEFLKKVNVIDLSISNPCLIDAVIEVRKLYRVKLPDAIIAAMAQNNSAVLLTCDREFTKIDSLVTYSWLIEL
jgi:predicted nucleic acid-binding protein